MNMRAPGEAVNHLLWHDMSAIIRAKAGLRDENVTTPGKLS
jgi:hypothetical protein